VNKEEVFAERMKNQVQLLDILDSWKRQLKPKIWNKLDDWAYHQILLLIDKYKCPSER